jgi:hypothetical protein
MIKYDPDAEANEYEKYLWQEIKIKSPREVIENVLRLYVYLGLVIAVGGVGYLIISTLNISLSYPQRMALLISVCGVALSFSSVFLLKFRKQRTQAVYRKMRLVEYLGEFVQVFAHFEGVATQVLQTAHVAFNRFSIRQVIELLRAEDKLNDEDVLALEEALQVRNAVLHGGEDIPSDFLIRQTRAVRKITGKLLRLTDRQAQPIVSADT